MLPKMNLDLDKAERIWEDYERNHDLTGREREAVGIDPETGEVFFGESAGAITLRLVKEGRNRPLFFRWVDNPIYGRKGKPRRRMTLPAVGAFLLSASLSLTGCEAPPESGGDAGQPELTAEAARDALVERLRAGNGNCGSL